MHTQLTYFSGHSTPYGYRVVVFKSADCRLQNKLSEALQIAPLRASSLLRANTCSKKPARRAMCSAQEDGANTSTMVYKQTGGAALPSSPSPGMTSMVRLPIGKSD